MASKTLRIGIDASSILPPRTGVGNYTLSLVRALAKNHPNLQLILFMNSLRRALPDEDFLHLPNVSVRRHRLPGPLLLRMWQYMNWPSIETFVGPVDVFHSPSGHIPPQSSGAAVATIHDTFFLKDAKSCDTLGGKYLLKTLPRRLRHLAHVIVPTEAVRAEVVAHFQIPETKVSAIHEGVDLVKFQPDLDSNRWASLRHRMNLPERFILFVGTQEPRKNLKMLIDCYERLCRRRPDLVPLVITGGKGWGESINLSTLNGIRFVGFVPDEDLVTLYSRCKFFVFPSLDEGFGLPVLEAMACGAPVVCSDIPALAEVGGDATLRASPTDPSAWENALEQVLDDCQLKENLRHKGLLRARQFVWKQCAEKTAEIYRRVAEERRPQGELC